MNKKLIIILVILALLGLGVYFYMRFKSQSNGNEEPGEPSNGPEPFPLKLGSKGPEVGQVQKYLIREFGAKVSESGLVDNWWGPLTDAAVSKFLQRDNVSASFYYKTKMDKY